MANLSTRVRIAALLETGRALSAAEIARRVRLTRPVVNRHLAALVKEGQVMREGAGRRVRYRAVNAPPEGPATPPPASARTPPPAPARAATPPPARTGKSTASTFVRRYPRAVISEGRVWEELVAANTTLAGLSRPAQEIFRYAFTEMLNNAIEHSQGNEVEVRLARGKGDLPSFEILDDGVGLFSSLRQRFGFDSVEEAVKRLSQGKLPALPDERRDTTDAGGAAAPGRGAGVFFSSRAARRFEIESNGYRWLVDNGTGTAAAANATPRQGTRVRFEGDPQPRRTLGDLFARHTEHTGLHKTRVVVTLGTSFISRVEAQRLLSRLERFHTVVLDFKDVKEIGQGFADEVFRVWPHDHPDVTLEPINMSPGVSLMVDHARRLR
jgi:DNA-binding transcriptional ArsR family regulator